MTTAAVKAPRSPWWLAFRVFDEPGQVFTELALRPRALVPALMLVVVSLGVAFGVPSTVLQRATTQQFDAINSRRPGTIPPEIRQRAAQQAGGVANRIQMFVAAGGVGLAFLAISAAILSLLFNSLSSTEIGFKDEWAIVTHAYMPQIVGIAATWVGIAMSGDMTFRVALGFLVPPETSQFGHSLAQQFTIFGAWNVYLLALGNQIKMKAAGIGLPLGILGGIWLLINVLFAWLSSMLGGMLG